MAEQSEARWVWGERPCSQREINRSSESAVCAAAGRVSPECIAFFSSTPDGARSPTGTREAGWATLMMLPPGYQFRTPEFLDRRSPAASPRQLTAR